MGGTFAGWVCETHPDVPYDTYTCGAPGMPAPAGRRVEVGCYVRPADAADDFEAIHSHEGTCWAIERMPEPGTGELVDHLHVVHVQRGELRWSILTADRVGTIDPPHLADIDSLVKLAARQLLKHGRRGEHRLFALVHAMAGVLAQPQHQPDMPSVFDDPEEETAPRSVCQECGRPLVAGRCPVHTPDPVTLLVRRFDALGRTEQNEVRRIARDRSLPYLEAGAAITLGDQVAYDVLLKRWERQAARAAS